MAFFLFLLDELHRLRAQLDGDAAKLLTAGRCSETFNVTLEKANCRPTNGEIQLLWDSLQEFLSITKEIGTVEIPKRHMLLHMLRMIPEAGNPRFYACWHDEGLNKMLKMSCRLISQVTFDISVLHSMWEQLGQFVEQPTRRRKR